MRLSVSTLVALLPFYLELVSAQGPSGSGKTTRYWDCWYVLSPKNQDSQPYPLSHIWLANRKGNVLKNKSSKPSCGWPKKSNNGQVQTCDKNDRPLNDGGNTRSGCDSGGSAYMCSGQGPWALNETLAYGWAAVNIAGSNEAQWCCSCYELTFTSGPIAGKKMIVQATNTGGDLGNNHFDLAVR